jgi:acyl carrier protein
MNLSGRQSHDPLFCQPIICTGVWSFIKFNLTAGVNMSESLTIEEIKRLVSLQLGIRDVGDNDRFLEELGAESVDIMNIIVAVEEKFKIEIKESEIPDVPTPLALYRFVESRI